MPSLAPVGCGLAACDWETAVAKNEPRADEAQVSRADLREGAENAPDVAERPEDRRSKPARKEQRGSRAVDLEAAAVVTLAACVAVTSGRSIQPKNKGPAMNRRPSMKR